MDKSQADARRSAILHRQRELSYEIAELTERAKLLDEEFKRLSLEWMALTPVVVEEKPERMSPMEALARGYRLCNVCKRWTRATFGGIPQCESHVKGGAKVARILEDLMGDD